MCARSGSLSRLSAHRSRSHARRCAPYRPRNASVSNTSGVRCSPTARRTAWPPDLAQDRPRDRRRPHRIRHLGARHGRPARTAAGRGGHAREVARARRLADQCRARAREDGGRVAARRRDAARATRCRPRHRVTSNASRSRVRASSTSSWRRRGCTTCSPPRCRKATTFGHGDAYADARINLEFVSVNPTGPLHAGGGRWVAVGDAIANLLGAQGAVVHREYYLNDAGGQLDTYTASLMARYRGEAPPEDGYQGAYLVDFAVEMRAELGDDVTDEQARHGASRGRSRGIRDDLERIGVHFDTWFSEQSLHDAGAVAAVLDDLRRQGHTYEQDGAVWLRGEALGDQRDRVLVRGNGSTTYLTNDLAYHRNKVARGWEHLIDIWGADHHGQVKSLQVGMRALGIGTDAAPEPEVILGQLVRLERGGELVRIVEARRHDHHARRHPRRGRPRRRAAHVPAAGHRHRADLRPRRGHAAVDGEPRLLRAVRARAGRVDRPEGRSGGGHAPAARRRRPRRARPRARARSPARARGVPRHVLHAARAARAPPRHHVGARLRVAVPRLLPRLPRPHRRRRAHPGSAVAGGGHPGRPRERARDPRRRARPTSWSASTPTTRTTA